MFRLHFVEAQKEYPKYRGNVRCFYWDRINKSEPWLTFGPDWKYLGLQLFVINAIVLISINTLDHESWFFITFNCFLIAYDVSTIIFAFANPGLAPKDPWLHTLDYL
jgi:hypothetical protein